MTEPATTRRGFLSFLTSVLASVPVLGGLFVLVRTGLAPSHCDKPDRFPLCRADEIPDDDLLVRSVSFEMRCGPQVERVARVVFVTRDPEAPDTVLAMSGECTHLSCPVQKTGKASDYVKGDLATAPLHCPCHGGVFSRTGQVLDGPPPRPLRRLRLEMPADGKGMIHLLEV